MGVSDLKSEEASELARAARIHFTGHSPDVQGAALAELLALWLAGHRVPVSIRLALLHMHVEYVVDLIPIMEREIELMLNKTGTPA